MQIKLLTILLVACFAISCGPKEITPTSQLHDQVMVVHDEVMPKMKDIYKLKKALRKLNKDKSDESIMSAIAALSTADDEMMDWMAEYSRPKQHSAESILYLKGQMAKIKVVKSSMLAAINNAQTIINEK